jgi:lipoate-protein ligase B
MDSEHPLEKLMRQRRGEAPAKTELEVLEESAEEELRDMGISIQQRKKPVPVYVKNKLAAKKKAAKQARKKNR